MKKLIVILSIGMAPLLNANAQPNNAANEQAIESLKIAFLSRHLNLTPEEAQKFWPVYNQYDNEMKKLRKEHQLEKGGGDELVWQEAILNLKKRFKPEFLKCISQEKFNRLLTVHQDWKDVIKKELRRRKEFQLTKERIYQNKERAMQIKERFHQNKEKAMQIKERFHQNKEKEMQGNPLKFDRILR